MIFKCGPSEQIYSFCITEKVLIETELKLHNVQIIANEINGFNNLCFCKLFVIFEIFCVFSPFLLLSLTNDRSHLFPNDFLVNLSKILSL